MRTLATTTTPLPHWSMIRLRSVSTSQRTRFQRNTEREYAHREPRVLERRGMQQALDALLERVEPTHREHMSATIIDQKQVARP